MFRLRIAGASFFNVHFVFLTLSANCLCFCYDQFVVCYISTTLDMYEYSIQLYIVSMPYTVRRLNIQSWFRNHNIRGESIIVSDFTISLYGSSWNYVFAASLQYFTLLSLFYLLAYYTRADGERLRPKRYNNMNCRTQKMVQSRLLDLPQDFLLII